jgi:hypothetical protein
MATKLKPKKSVKIWNAIARQRKPGWPKRGDLSALARKLGESRELVSYVYRRYWRGKP